VNAASPPIVPDRDQLELLLGQVDQRIQNQRDEWDGLDRKATTILATTGILLGLVINNVDDLSGTPTPGPSVFFLALVTLVAALGAGVIAMFPRRFGDAPDPQPFLDLYAARPTDETLASLASTKAGEHTKNTATVRLKVQAVRTQMVLVMAAGVLLAVLLVIVEVT
jgi:hypothetical protein